jgi:predicted RNase H-like HicB family nuclease
LADYQSAIQPTTSRRYKLDKRQRPGYGVGVNVPLTAEIHQEGEWYIAFCPEMPEANGQGRTQKECLENLKDAILLLLEDRRADARKQTARGVVHELV